MEEELHQEEAKNRREQDREMRIQEYFRAQKQKLYEHQKILVMKQRADEMERREDQMRSQQKEWNRLQRNEENVSFNNCDLLTFILNYRKRF